MNNKIVSNYHESNVAKALGGRKTANSGATPFMKGDVLVGNVIIECKTKLTETKSFTVYEGWLKEIEEEKIGMNKVLSALAISFNAGKNSYYVIDEKAMKILIDVINNGD